MYTIRKSPLTPIAFMGTCQDATIRRAPKERFSADLARRGATWMIPERRALRSDRNTSTNRGLVRDLVETPDEGCCTVDFDRKAPAVGNSIFKFFPH